MAREHVLHARDDLRAAPRRSGRVVSWLGERLELAGIRLQTIGAELEWRKLRAMRRWGT